MFELERFDKPKTHRTLQIGNNAPERGKLALILGSDNMKSGLGETSAHRPI